MGEQGPQEADEAEFLAVESQSWEWLMTSGSSLGILESCLWLTGRVIEGLI